MGDALALVELVELSDVGRVRHHNEDRALGRPPVIAVADGMGGAKAGEVAAQMAVDAVGALRGDASPERVRDALERANAEIHELARRDAEKAGMGTTMTAAVLSGAAVSVVHVGDSRAYLWRDGELSQITEDHSVVAELVRRGSLSPTEAETHPHRNVITRALGAERTVSADLVSQPVREGDVILLCTDGLSTYVSDADIGEALGAASGLEAAARALIDLANRAGGADNVTVVLARVGGAPAPDGVAAASDTVERQRPGGARGDTAPMRVLGGVRGHAGTDREGAVPMSSPARVLEPVERRRGRAGLVVALAAVAIVLLAGAAFWVDSRTYVVEAGPGDTVRVSQGIPLSLGGIDLGREWQTTGVPVETVSAERPGALSTTWRGQGDAVELAVDLIWRFGLPDVPAIAAPEPAAPAPGPAAPGAPVPPGEAS
jgi:PPM family protein phosphatase